MKRLAFIRLLHQQGVEQSHLPEPLIFSSILSFHDAVELFLVLTAEHLSAFSQQKARQIKFEDYWPELHPSKLANGVELAGKVSMSTLNRHRNSLKHAGVIPSRQAVEQARADVRSFFQENTPKVFGIPFDGIDMADIVPQEEIRKRVKEAAAKEAEGDRGEAMAVLREALRDLLHELEKPDRWYRSPFTFGPDIMWPMNERDIYSVLWREDTHQHPAPRLPARGVGDLASQISNVTSAVMEMQAALRIMVIGIDYHRYQRFRKLTPHVQRTFGGGRDRSFPPNYAPNRDEYDYCFNFLISAALRVADFQAHTVLPSWETDA
ncbi:hypothetical protein [Microbispora sp. CA-102843]|uniref:hypothetical protein n=1 Tax=Microbispora sp. CA-102843 TaxID=3239952 RepID=UPI003D9036CC